MVSRGGDHERLERSASLADDHEALRAIETQIAPLEIARDALLHEPSDRDEQQGGRRFVRGRNEPERGDDSFQER